MNVIVRTTPSSAESRKPLPLNKGDPSWLDMRAWTYHQFCADLRTKRAKATFCLKFDLLLISSILAFFGQNWARGTRLIILVCRTSWSNCWHKKQIQNYCGYIKVSVYYVLQREDVALNSMNQLTIEFSSFTHNCSILSTTVSEQKKKTKKAGGGGDAQ